MRCSVSFVPALFNVTRAEVLTPEIVFKTADSKTRQGTNVFYVWSIWPAFFVSHVLPLFSDTSFPFECLNTFSVGLSSSFSRFAVTESFVGSHKYLTQVNNLPKIVERVRVWRIHTHECVFCVRVTLIQVFCFFMILTDYFQNGLNSHCNTQNYTLLKLFFLN